MVRKADKKIEAELLERYVAGDEGAFREIVYRYKDGLYAFLRRFLRQEDMIEDAFQDAFLQVYTSRQSFDMARPLRPWLYTIAANKARDLLRKRQREHSIPLGGISEPAEMSIDDVLNTLKTFETTPYDEVARSETAESVRQVIANMPDNLREILLLAYFDGFSYKQMAEILGIPIGTVKSRLHTAVGSFMKRWKGQSPSKENK